MGESATHVALVKALVQWVRANCALENANLFVDISDQGGRDTPPRVDGFVPDVYVDWIGLSRKLIGEAKAPRDLETRRSHDQLSAFLRYLAMYDDSTLLIATPWYRVPSAKSLIESLKSRCNAESVRTVFLEKLPD
jgi:hypothetical protein